MKAMRRKMMLAGSLPRGDERPGRDAQEATTTATRSSRNGAGGASAGTTAMHG